MRPYRSWHEILIEDLSDPKEAVSYLAVAFEEYLYYGDKEFFLDEIKNIIEAQGGAFNISKESGINLRFLSDTSKSGFMPDYNILESIKEYFKGLYTDNLANQMALDIPITESSYEPVHIVRKLSPEQSKPKNLTKRESQNFEYWKGLSKYIESKNSIIRQPVAHISNSRDIKTGIKGFSLRATQTVRYKKISASLVVRGNNSIRNFYSLRIQEQEIESDFGNKLEWNPKRKNEKLIHFVKHDVNPGDERDWDNQHKWMVDSLEKMYTTFQPRIKIL